MLKLLQRFKKDFEKGGKFQRFYAIYEMVETILFVPPHKTNKGAHIRDAFDMKRFMFFVVIAATPAFLVGIYNAGLQHFLAGGTNPGFLPTFIKGLLIVMPIYIVTLAAGGVWEVLFAVVRKHEVNEGFLVTSFLIPMILPPTIPLWQVAVSTSFGIVISKEVFGGVGMNIFNPALVSRAFLFFAYPKAISGDSVWTLFPEKIIDTYTTATPLAVIGESGSTSAIESLNCSGYNLWDLVIGFIPGSIGETSFIAIMLGSIFLLVTGIASWRITFSVFAGAFALVTLFNLVTPDSSHIMALPFHYHIVLGGFAFGAVFMATDPVSASATNVGKYIYGFGIGIMAILVRVLNPAYPEGMMLAILFMNLFAPLIDHSVLAIHKKRRMNRGKK